MKQALKSMSVRSMDFQKCMCLMAEICEMLGRKEKFRAEIESGPERVSVKVYGIDEMETPSGISTMDSMDSSRSQ